MKYIIFYTGLASTPDSVGLKNLTTNEVICEISCSRSTGKETREKYQKYKKILNTKYSNLVN
jgi:hypothetical protein